MHLKYVKDKGVTHCKSLDNDKEIYILSTFTENIVQY